MNLKPTLEALQKAVYASGMKSVAAVCGCSPQYLGRVVNPDPEPDEVKNIHLRTFVQIMLTTKDCVPLSMLAGELGYSLVPNTGMPDKATVAEECTDDMIDLGAFTRVVNNPSATAQEVRAASLAVRKNIRETEALKISEIEKRTSKAVA